ncbi:MAG: methyltransferase domain-containing protein [Synechococcaceae cyanobacterium SM2_3_1]|nr:methyltransferase domain-containing protein [Synechococcaceae cyanobacterium SM2_3_1]
MTSPAYTGAVSTARDYYNSSDADNFYFTIWGGEDIHIGLYKTDSASESIAAASRRTVEHLISLLPPLSPQTRILDIGAGYGGAARHLAKSYGCHVTALNLSEVENERNRSLSAAAGLDSLVEVMDGSFEQLPFPDPSFDVVWSQDAILHSSNRQGVLQEVARVLRPGGHFVFTDPMQANTCPEGVLQPILDRIHLGSLGSPQFYEQAATDVGLQPLEFQDNTHQLVRHYRRVLQETTARAAEIQGLVSDAYQERMKKGLGHWIEGGEKGYLAWGFFHFQKPEG